MVLKILFLIEKEFINCENTINKYLKKEFLKVFEYNQTLVSFFCKHKETSGTSGKKDISDINIYHDSGIDIEVGTVHSVKGETHVATLYMETFYFLCVAIAKEHYQESDEINNIWDVITV